MNKTLTSLFSISILLVATLTNAFAETSPKTNFRRVTIPEGSIWAYVDVEKTIYASPERVWGVISDLSSWPKWLPMNARFDLLSNESIKFLTPEIAADKPLVEEIAKKFPSTEYKVSYAGKQEVVAVEEYDLPWPIQNEWVVRQYKFSESNGTMTAIWKKLDSTLDEDDGGWEVVPTKDPDKTTFKYHYRVKVKDGIPQPIFKTAISLVVGSMVKSLEAEVHRRK